MRDIMEAFLSPLPKRAYVFMALFVPTLMLVMVAIFTVATMIRGKEPWWSDPTCEGLAALGIFMVVAGKRVIDRLFAKRPEFMRSLVIDE